jgi:Domain of unknown function (DUF4202)
MTGVDLEVEGGVSSPGGFDARSILDALGAEFPTLMVDVYEPLVVGPFAPSQPRGRGATLPFEEEARRLLVSTTELKGASLPVQKLDDRVRDMARRGPFTLALVTTAADVALSEGIVTRYQRFIARRNVHSRVPVFERVLAKHRRIFALDRPSALFDYEHARDTWHWVLRLDREASLSVQLAALFHDVDRLTHERDTDEKSVDDAAAREAHARESAYLALEILDGLGLEEETLARTVRLIERHEAPEGEEGRLLADADALSFLAQSHPVDGGAGGAPARRKMASKMSRLRASSRAFVDRLWLSGEVRALLAEAT